MCHVMTIYGNTNQMYQRQLHKHNTCYSPPEGYNCPWDKVDMILSMMLSHSRCMCQADRVEGRLVVPSSNGLETQWVIVCPNME